MRSILTSFQTAPRVVRGFTALAVLGLAACGGSGGTPANNVTSPVTPTGPTDVGVTNNAFSPASLNVATGSSVTWTWNSCTGGDGYGSGQTCVEHNIVFDDGPTSGVLSQGTYKRTFTAAGTYAYHCAIHGAVMSGKVVVQ